MKDSVDRLIFAYNIVKVIDEELEDCDTKQQLLEGARIERKKALESYMDFGKET